MRAALSVTSNPAGSPPSVTVASPIRSDGSVSWSSSMIVPVPLASSRVASTGWLNTTVKVSSGSLASSSRVDTWSFLLVVPAGKVSCPLVAV